MALRVVSVLRGKQSAPKRGRESVPIDLNHFEIVIYQKLPQGPDRPRGSF